MREHNIRLGNNRLKTYRITFAVDDTREEGIIITAENKTEAKALFKKLVGNKKIKSVDETKDVKRRS